MGRYREFTERGVQRLRFIAIAVDRHEHIGKSLAHYFKLDEAQPIKLRSEFKKFGQVKSFRYKTIQ